MLKMMDFALKMMDFALKMMDFVLKMMDFALKMMDFAGRPSQSLVKEVLMKYGQLTYPGWIPVMNASNTHTPQLDFLCIKWRPAESQRVGPQNHNPHDGRDPIGA